MAIDTADPDAKNSKDCIANSLGVVVSMQWEIKRCTPEQMLHWTHVDDWLLTVGLLVDTGDSDANEILKEIVTIGLVESCCVHAVASCRKKDIPSRDVALA